MEVAARLRDTEPALSAFELDMRGAGGMDRGLTKHFPSLTRFMMLLRHSMQTCRVGVLQVWSICTAPSATIRVGAPRQGSPCAGSTSQRCWRLSTCVIRYCAPPLPVLRTAMHPPVAPAWRHPELAETPNSS